ncbi:MAG: ubiquinol--cytochrome-c reductase subunit 6 [Peltula sp. TS41687]|nr:MAG: ubiquinol--cytochrome-c reductase subunit 6 [Peltula sp. TS41687]
MGLTDLLSDFYTSLTFTEAHAEANQAADVDHVVQGKAEYGDKEETSDDKGAADNDRSSSGGGGDGDGEEDSNKAGGGDSEEGGEPAEDAAEGGAGEEAAEEEEEEEEDDEPVDPKPKLEDECAKSSQCMPYKHHYDECVERVMEHEKHAASGAKKGPKEDCVEECELSSSSFDVMGDVCGRLEKLINGLA